VTLTEKILAQHAGKEHVRPGDLITVKLDFILANDITAPPAIAEFNKIGAKKVFDPDRIALIPDHFTPNKDIKSAEQVKILRDFAKKHGIVNYFDVGRMGVEHALLPEKGLVVPGDCIIGADSHTCTYGAIGAFATGVGSTDMAAAMITGETWLKVPPTIKVIFNGAVRKWVSGKDLILFLIGQTGVDGALYKALEFSGSTIDSLSVEGRLTMANMAIEAGAKNGIFIADEKTLAFYQGRAKRKPRVFLSDADAHYEKILQYDASQIEPTVACPDLPSNARPVSQLDSVKVDQVVIGSCTNGRIEDLRIAASIIKGRSVHTDVRMIVIPATQDIWLQAMQEGLLEIFVKSGAAVSTPTCGPCLGGHMGILAEGETAVATTNRNFVGRMGHVRSKVYLASPAVAAATAIRGVICSPEVL
jgi:3-isopropylmalate/(R)-2-methylmalate dehydratase large subunit